MSKHNVYWAPLFYDGSDWNILHKTPETLFDRKLKEHIRTDDKRSNFFYCPAFKDFAKNTFVVTNPLRLNHTFGQANSSSIPMYQNRESCLKNYKVSQYGLSWLFFCDDDIDITVTSPYFDNVPHLQYGTIVPGKFNAGSWFRPINLEYTFYPGVDEVIIKEDEPLAYINFCTDSQVNLIRFNATEDIKKIASTCSSGANWESWVPMKKRYQRFKNSRLKNRLMKLIKENLYD